jgi:C_GCAxxG_C_C family probable redox protein
MIDTMIVKSRYTEVNVSEKTVDLIGKARHAGFQYEKQYGNCCQCTIAALQDTLGIRDDSVFQAGSGMAGGIGGNCDGVCGGYSGGVMHLSRMFGRTRNRITEEEAHALTNQLASKLHAKFIEEYGSVICRDIHQRIFGRTFNLWDAEDVKAIEAAGSHVDKCTTVVGNASAWAAEIALEEMAKHGWDAR